MTSGGALLDEVGAVGDAIAPVKALEDGAILRKASGGSGGR